MPISGRVPPPDTEAASSVPTNGPTQAKEASENVRPISSVPSEAALVATTRSRRVRIADGIVISNAPSRLRPKTMNRAR